MAEQAVPWKGHPAERGEVLTCQPCPLGLEYFTKGCLFMLQEVIKRVAVTLLTSKLVMKFDRVFIISNNNEAEIDMNFVV